MHEVRNSTHRDLIGRTGSLTVFAAAGLTVTLFALTPTTTQIALAHFDGVTLGTFRIVGASVLIVPLILLWRLQCPRCALEWGLLAVSGLGSFAAFRFCSALEAKRYSRVTPP